MQETESTRSVLEFLSFEADQSTQGLAMPSTPQRNGTSSGSKPTGVDRHLQKQGILWKRRDVFRNRWRPRWFVLHSDQRILTYYILANQESERIVSTGSTSTPSRRRSSAVFPTPSSSSMSIGSTRNSSHSNNDSRDENRRRPFSEASGVSAQEIDCDVVPRGTIYLFGATVEANEALTVPEEDLFTLTITDHENSTHCHLAARTLESRDEWINCIRRVCEDRNAQQELRLQFSPQTPMPTRGGGTTIMGTIGMVAKRTHQDPSDSQQNNHQRTITEHVSREKEILVVFAPVVLYKALTMMSFIGIATICFIVTSTMALRWIVIQQFLRVVRPLSKVEQTENSLNTSSIWNGSICCRLTEDLTNICHAGSNASLSHIMVWSIAKAIRQQPRLASKKYKLLPSFYSSDIEYLDLNNKALHGSAGVWVSKADEKSLNAITECFKTAETQDDNPIGLLQRAIGPACRIVMAPNGEDDTNEGGSQQVDLELKLCDCPITVLVSCSTRAEQSSCKKASVSISFKSTDIKSCRKFAEDFQESMRSDKV